MINIIKKSIIWLLKSILKSALSILIFFLTFAIILSIFAYQFSDEKVSIKPNSYLILSFPNGITESPDQSLDLGLPSSLLVTQKGKLGFYNVLKSIEFAAKDPKIKGIIIKLDLWNVGKEKTDEIIKSLEKLKKESGKKIYAFGNYIANGNYKIASICDEIIMPPSKSAAFHLSGYSRSFAYYKDLADKLGVTVNVIHIGDFKSYGENYSKNKMSEQFKQEIGKIFEKLESNFTNFIAEKRSLDRLKFEKALYNGNYAILDANKAIEYKLIDKAQNYYELENELKMSGENKLRTIGINRYTINVKTLIEAQKLMADLSDSTEKIAVLFLEGEITMNFLPGIGKDNSITPGNVGKELDLIQKDKKIKGLILRVNSPGGSALASEIILQKIKEIQKNIPVYVSMGSVAASGGYYISASAEKIFAEKSTITGSIGVVSMLPNINELNKKLGINYETINKGKFSNLDFLNKEKITEDEIYLIRNTMKLTYDEFKERVSQGRGMDLEKLETIAQGKVWTGEQALEIGLVDGIAGLEETILAMKNSLNEKDDSKNLQIVTYPKEKSFMEKVYQLNLNEILSPKISLFGKENGSLNLEINKLMNNYKRAISFDGKPLMLMPNNIWKE